MHSSVKGTTMRHLYAIVWGVLIQLYMFGAGVLHVLLISGVVYLMMLLLPRKSQARLVMWFVLAYLSGQHIYRMWYDFGGFNLDITTFTMLLVCRLSALAYCYQDGAETPDKLTTEQQQWRVTSLPNLLEYTSYVFFCNSAALGVFFEFSDYKKFIEQTHEYQKVPSPVMMSICWMTQAFTWVAIFMLGSSYFSLPDCWGDEYATWPFWYKVVFYHLAMSFKRFFYYGPFSFTTGAIIASGLGYNGQDKEGKHKWDKIIQIFVIEIETGKSPNELLRYWNHQVHLWLKYYIGARITPKDKRPTFGANMVVFLVSAFWHGFYPFYYVTFVCLFIFTEVSKDVFKAKKFLFYGLIPVPAIRHLLANQATLVCLDYFGTTFNALTFDNGIKFMSANYFCVPVLLVGLLAVSRVTNLVGRAQRWENKHSAQKDAKKDQ